MFIKKGRLRINFRRFKLGSFAEDVKVINESKELIFVSDSLLRKIYNNRKGNTLKHSEKTPR